MGPSASMILTETGSQSAGKRCSWAGCHDSVTAAILESPKTATLKGSGCDNLRKARLAGLCYIGGEPARTDTNERSSCGEMTMFMAPLVVLLVGVVTCMGASLGFYGHRADARLAVQPAPRPASYAPSPGSELENPRAVLARYCTTCHNQRLRTGGLALDRLDPRDLAKAPETWEKVIKKPRASALPPATAPRPDPVTYRGLLSWLEGELDRLAAINPNPGRPAVHRLNRAEYANAIRDLLALDVDASSQLPSDDSSYGFDNV